MTDNLYSALTRVYQKMVIMEQVTTQMLAKLWEADKMVANYSKKGKLVLQMVEKMGSQDKKIRLLEEACMAMTFQKEQAEEGQKRAASELADE